MLHRSGVSSRAKAGRTWWQTRASGPWSDASRRTCQSRLCRPSLPRSRRAWRRTIRNFTKAGTSSPARCVISSSATTAMACCSSSAPRCSFCSSPARTSPACNSSALRTRQRDVAIRLALGASRGTIARSYLIESLLLVTLGGLGGLLIGSWGLDVLLASLSREWIPRSDEIALNAPVLLITGAAALLTGLLFGLFPALHATRVDAIDSLRDGTKGSAGVSSTRLRGALVVAQIALTLVLLVCARTRLEELRQHHARQSRHAGREHPQHGHFARANAIRDRTEADRILSPAPGAYRRPAGCRRGWLHPDNAVHVGHPGDLHCRRIVRRRGETAAGLL